MAVNKFGIGGFDSADSSFQGLGTVSNTFNIVAEGCTDPLAFNYNALAITDDGSCIPVIAGCTDPNAGQYVVDGQLFLNANTDNGSCIYYGCTDDSYVEFDPFANTNQVSAANPLSPCDLLITYGCTDVSSNTIGDGSGFAYLNYINGTSTIGNPSLQPCDGTQPDIALACVLGADGIMQTGANCCCEPTVVGCMDSTTLNGAGLGINGALNYNASANTSPEPGSNLACIYDVPGCTDPLANNFVGQATSDDGSCTYDIVGCMDPNADNYDADANVLGLCEFWGCTDNTTPNGSGAGLDGALNYDAQANVDDGSCTYNLPYGCTDPIACNYMPNAIIDDGECIYAVSGPCSSGYPGCNDPVADNFDPNAGSNDGSCVYTGTLGCTDPTAVNYDATATVDDGSCIYPVIGCTDNAANNYDATATVDDGSCTYDILGCTDLAANNYDATANIDDGSCAYTVLGCTDATADNYDATANTDDGSCTYTGCTDPLASNYNALATTDDGSCSYPPPPPACMTTNITTGFTSHDMIYIPLLVGTGSPHDMRGRVSNAISNAGGSPIFYDVAGNPGSFVDAAYAYVKLDTVLDIESIDLRGLGLTDDNSEDWEFIYCLVNLEELKIGNTQFTVSPNLNDFSSIDLSVFVGLTDLHINRVAALTTLDLSANTELRILEAQQCGFETIDFTNNIKLFKIYLGYFSVENSTLTTVTGLNQLIELNQFSAIYCTKITSLEFAPYADPTTANPTQLEYVSLDNMWDLTTVTNLTNRNDLMILNAARCFSITSWVFEGYSTFSLSSLTFIKIFGGGVLPPGYNMSLTELKFPKFFNNVNHPGGCQSTSKAPCVIQAKNIPSLQQVHLTDASDFETDFIDAHGGTTGSTNSDGNWVVNSSSSFSNGIEFVTYTP